ncbi:MAG: glutamate synthase subunit alpha, partial [Gammaproteobacteria bacterium]|nr:glutamate synthase subunit alpha [Gammaproteobacteria bacterium]
SKAHADHVTISGYEGGTGASPLTSIKHAGSPWEIGLAETQQTLVRNQLRGRIAVQVDGGLRTGRDVAVAALLGADEFGFATAPLIASGCIMMRKCHLNTCPVGIATQDPRLRKRFTGQPEHVVNYFFFVAEELREIMAKLGFATVDEMIGRVDRLKTQKVIRHFKTKGLDYSRILARETVGPEVAIHNSESQDHGLENVLDRELVESAKPALDSGLPVIIHIDIRNTDRTAGAMLSGEIAKQYGHKGLKDNTVVIKARGTAGQSFGAWLAKGVSIELEGEANDYVGKGLSGGRMVVFPPQDTSMNNRRENIIVGNTVLYGAIFGECYFSGVAGERFCVRNSGAIAVIEGVGDHGCEYMTGGVVVCLGQTGRNFAAGMSGGIAYVYDEAGDFEKKCNMQMVALEPVDPDQPAESIDNPLEADEARLHHYISRHLEYTGSPIAKNILGNWNESRSRFVRIMPHDYRQALEFLYSQMHEKDYKVQHG